MTYTPYADEVAEAEAVAAAVERLRDAGTPPGEVAVLFRINAQSEAYEEALAARGIPYVVRGAARFFDRAEVREAVTRLRGAARGGTTVEDDLPGAVRAVLSVMGWTPEAPAARGQTRDRWESLQALVDQAAEQAAAGVTELGDFVDDLDRRASEQHAPVAGGVTLATLHTAKGLEWDAVFVVGVCEGTLPITYAESPTEVEEERRLLYVGITRARHTLAVSWAWARNPGGRATRQPSRFLDPLLPAGARTQPTGAQEPQGRQLPRVRQAAGHRAGEEARPLRRLPGVLRRGAVRGAAHLALGAGGRGERAGVRRLHRRHPAADRRAQTPFGAGPAAHQRHRPDQARPLRRRGSRPRGLDISKKSENTSKKNCSPQRVHGTLLIRTKQPCAQRP